MPDQTALLAWSCIALGLWMSGYAIRCVASGRTRGYYADHLYERDDEGSGYTRWIWVRLVLGVVCLMAGVAFV